MDKLLLQVRRARRRMIAEQYLRWVVWCLFAALLLASAAIALPQVVVIEGLPENWAAWWIGSALVGAVVVAGIATWWTRQSILDAAIEIDQRYGLRERVASSLGLAPVELETAAGQALLHDATRRIERIDVAEKFRPQIDRRAWLPLVPGALVFALVMFGTHREAASNVEPSPTAEAKVQIKRATDPLLKKLAEKRQEADDKKLAAAEETFKQVSAGLKELNKSELQDRKQATVKLNNLAKQLEERRNKLGSAGELQKQIEQMKKFGQGPAEKIAEAMKQGDWKKALDELNKLQEKIAGEGLNEEEKQQLTEQLHQMKEKLAQAAEANRDARNELQKQIDEQRKQGNLAKAGELQQKLDQLAQQQPQMENLEQLAQQLQQCQDCLQNGDQQGAAQAMAELAEQLDQMQQDLDEMQMLDEALAQLEAAKNAMACQQCQGEGCQACGGGGGQNDQFANAAAGDGIGVGRGPGISRDEEIDAQYRDSRVRQNPTQGEATFGGFVDGPNIKGETAAVIDEEMSAIRSQPADPLTLQRLPRTRAEQAEQYFQKLNNR